MHTKPLGESNTVIRLRTSLENLRSFLVDLEALADAARETLDKLPFLPTSLSPRSEGQELESRLNYGRLQALVTATATSAKEVLLVCSEMVESSYEPPDTDEEDDEGSGSGGSGTPGSSRNGEPEAAGSGNEPQAQSMTEDGPDVSEPGHEPQGRQDVVEVSVDDIDDRPGELSGCPDGHVPRALRSRGGIMLDTATLPPGLTPLGLADSTRIAIQPTASA